MTERILVLGGGYAGTLAAVRMGRRLRQRAQITVVSASDVLVDRIRLHQRLAGNHPAARPLAPLLRRAGVKLVVGRATAWDPSARAIEVDGARIGYDRILYALGSLTDVERVPGVRGNAFTLEPESVARLAEALPAVARSHGRVVVCGGGLTAVETASELAERFPDLQVELVTRGEMGGFLSAAGRAHLQRAFDRRGIGRREQTQILEVRPDAVVTDADPVAFEICVWAGGFVANPLAGAAGLLVNERGQLLVDERLRVESEPSVFGAGDAVAPAGCALDMGCKTAMPTGAHAADVIATLVEGGTPRPFRYADSVYCVSLGRRDGIIQFMRPDGALLDRIWTGRRAAWLKERICRYTGWSTALQARGLLDFRWAQSAGARAAREPRRLPA